MAMMILEYKVMPADSETDFNILKKKVVETFESYGCNIKNIKEVPIGFGLVAVGVNFSLDEKKGTDEIEEIITNLDEVQNIELVSMSRALG